MTFTHYIKWDINISLSLRLFLKKWIWYRYKNRTENHYPHDGVQQSSFFKNVHIKTYKLIKKKGILVMLSFYVLCRTKMYYKKRRISICLFGKSHTQDIVKRHILHEES